MTEPAARVVLVTVPDRATGETLVRRLVEERLVACGNVLPEISSIYRWEGEIEHAREALVVFKTTAGAADRVVERVPALHPYEVPEVLVLPVVEGHGPYLDWVFQNVSG